MTTPEQIRRELLEACKTALLFLAQTNQTGCESQSGDWAGSIGDVLIAAIQNAEGKA